MQKATANYHHTIADISHRKVIVIVDLNQGGKSVTNDIENVVEEIAKGHRINADEYLIIYRDSENNWDGWDHATRSFDPLGCKTQMEAVEKYMAIEKSHQTLE